MLFRSWENRFCHGEAKYEWQFISGNEDDETDMYKMNQLNPDYWVDREGIKAYNERINNGMRLFGKYYRGLWD